MKRGWQVAVDALLAVFAFFAYESLQLSLRDALGPGPGFFPFWLGVAGAVLAARSPRPAPPAETWAPKRWSSSARRAQRGAGRSSA